MGMQDAPAMVETASEAATQYRFRQRPIDTGTLEIIRGKDLTGP
jgi:hypothetical protein